jgi:hypothetical protein
MSSCAGVARKVDLYIAYAASAIQLPFKAI